MVDEDHDDLLSQENLVRKHLPNCEIFLCQNKEEALVVAKRETIDSAIINIRPLVKKGFDIVKALKSDLSTRNIPTMLFSRLKADPQLVMEAFEAGADDFLLSTVDNIEFISRIRVLLRLKRAEDEKQETLDRLTRMEKEHRASLRSSEERYRRLVDISPDMIAVCKDGRTTFVSAAGSKILRAKNIEQLVGIPVIELVHPKSRGVMKNLLADCLLKDDAVPFAEMQFVASDKQIIDVEAAAIPFEYDGEQHIQLIVRDVSESKIYSERARQSQRMEAVGTLAGGVAHDFNNVLTTIRGYSELILESLDKDNPLHEDVEEIRRATERAAALTRQLLAFSRRQVLEPRPMDVNAVVVDMKRMLQRIIGEDIQLVTDLESELSTIKADRSQIEQVVMNLAVNARDAIEEIGKVTIVTKNVELDAEIIRHERLDLKPGKYIALEVSDTGTGMSRETIFQIFEPFFTTKPKDKGTGLGLSTVYGIVKQSEGDIAVESQLGKGTVFRIYLPAIDRPVSLPSPIRIPRATGGWETILLVEDEKTVRVLTKRMLERSGYRVLEARHGSDALHLCETQKEPIHLILTDVVMPEMGGRELVERLLKTHPEMRVLLMSGYSGDAVQRAGEIFENATFLQKPFSYEELTQKIRFTLDGDPSVLK